MTYCCPTSGAEIDLVTQVGFGCATASFAPDIVKATADRFGLPPIGDVTNIVLIPLERNKARMLRAAFEAAFSDAVARPHSDRAAAWSVTKQEDLLRVLLSCAANATSKTKSASNSERARIIKAVLEAINDLPGEILSIGDLCRIARASERTLDYAFIRIRISQERWRALRGNGTSLPCDYLSEFDCARHRDFTWPGVRTALKRPVLERKNRISPVVNHRHSFAKNLNKYVFPRKSTAWAKLSP
jgi:hypothetical protein